ILYTLTASYPGCKDTSVLFKVDMHRIPELELEGDQKVCQWEDVALTSQVWPYRNDYSYRWIPIDGLSNPDAPNSRFTADTSITYYLQVQTPIGCSDMDSVRIEVHPGD